MTKRRAVKFWGLKGPWKKFHNNYLVCIRPPLQVFVNDPLLSFTSYSYVFESNLWFSSCKWWGWSALYTKWSESLLQLPPWAAGKFFIKAAYSQSLSDVEKNLQIKTDNSCLALTIEHVWFVEECMQDTWPLAWVRIVLAPFPFPPNLSPDHEMTPSSEMGNKLDFQIGVTIYRMSGPTDSTASEHLVYIYIYIYMCVCVGGCVNKSASI